MSDISPPALREELKISKLIQQGELSYVIKEPDKQAYFHFSEPEYEAMVLFNGTRDLIRIVELFNQFSKRYEYDLEQINTLYESCRDFRLLSRTKEEQNAALLEKVKEERKKKLLQGQGSLLFLRFQLADPNDFFNGIINKIRFFWHPNVVKFQALFLMFAAVCVLFAGDRFLLDLSRVYLHAQESELGFLKIWLIALGAIAVHECGHGLTCKYFGGDVHEMGFLLLAFQPCLYCNVNDAWLFEDKWQKIYVALAGVWVELLLAGISAFVWLLVDVSNTIGFIAFILLTIGTATSLLVNLNPLLKFDGYYILTDLLEIQNLRQNAISWFSWSLKTKVLRLDEEMPLNPSKREQRVYLIYGSLVTLYMTMMLSFIALLGYEFISVQFGFFANIAFIYLVFVLLRKLTGTWGATLMTWLQKLCWRSSIRKRLSIISVLVFIGLLIFCQPHIRIVSNGVIAAPKHIIYAPENGFINYVGYTNNRQLVNLKNMPFLSLSSPDLTLIKHELKNVQHKIQMQQQEASASNETAQGRQFQIEGAFVDEKMLSLLEQQHSLDIFAPKGEWLVEGLPPQSIDKRFYHAGDEILTLIAKKQRFIEVIIDQRDVYLVSLGDKSSIRFTGIAPVIYHATVSMISPIATLDVMEQGLLVRLDIELTENTPVPPLGLSADIIIFGEPRPLWQHFSHAIRKILRADLWL